MATMLTLSPLSSASTQDWSTVGARWVSDHAEEIVDQVNSEHLVSRYTVGFTTSINKGRLGEVRLPWFSLPRRFLERYARILSLKEDSLVGPYSKEAPERGDVQGTSRLSFLRVCSSPCWDSQSHQKLSVSLDKRSEVAR